MPLKNNHLAQALLFCGPRGVGKTTCARILAKRINEADQVDDRDFSLNVFELDAASNNSVDDIRNLIDQVRFAPQVGNYKVYIIDEVHMLSQQAFNAFLKTLEEPPPHAIFILATTEKHKIIPTILSRCQIFDFKRITVEDTANHLAYVAKEEGIEADHEGLHIIAQKADGALRDALSIFDRLVSYNDNSLTYENVITNLDILDYDYFFKATDYILQQNLPQLLMLFDEILDKGFDGIQFVNGLASHFRDLLVGKDPQTIDLLEVGPSVKARYLEQSKTCQVPFLIFALRQLNECDVRYKTSSNQRLLVEVALMQLVNLLEKKKPESQPVLNKDAPRMQVPVKGTAAVEQKVTIAHPPAAAQQSVSEPEAASLSHPAKNTPAANGQIEKPANTDAKSPSQTERKPQPKGSWLTKLKGGASGISINRESVLAVNAKKDTSEEVEEVLTGPTEIFSDIEFEKAYKTFLASIPERKSVLGVLAAHKPKLKNLTEIHYQLENKTQESYLNSILPEMLGYLREELKNFKLRVIVEFSATSTERKPYTAEERYLAMVKINPQLEELRKALDMNVE